MEDQAKWANRWPAVQAVGWFAIISCLSYLLWLLHVPDLPDSVVAELHQEPPRPAKLARLPGVGKSNVEEPPFPYWDQAHAAWWVDLPFLPMEIEPEPPEPSEVAILEPIPPEIVAPRIPLPTPPERLLVERTPEPEPADEPVLLPPLEFVADEPLPPLPPPPSPLTPVVEERDEAIAPAELVEAPVLGLLAPSREVRREPIAAHEPPAGFRVETVELLQPTGKEVLLIIHVFDEDGQPVVEEPVEWSVERRGVGGIVEVPARSLDRRSAELVSPTFARTRTRRHASSTDGIELPAGATWIRVRSPAAGDMLLTVMVPRIAESSERRAEVRIHFDHASPRFPEPMELATGETARLETLVVGPRGEPLADYVVRYEMPTPGTARFAGGRSRIEATSDTLGRAVAVLEGSGDPNSSTLVRMALLGKQSPIGLESIVLAEGETSVSWRRSVESLEVDLDTPDTFAIGRSQSISLAIRNTGQSRREGLRLVAVLPSFLQSREHPPLVPDWDVLAEAGGLTWSLPPLEPGQAHRIDLVTRATRESGPKPLRVLALAGNVTAARAERPIRAEGIPSLRLTVRDAPDPVPVGGTVEHRLTIENWGTGTAENIRLLIGVSNKLRPVRLSGAIPAKLSDDKISLGPVLRLAPGERLECRILSEAIAPGEARLRFQAIHPSAGPDPIESQESTMIYGSTPAPAQLANQPDTAAR